MRWNHYINGRETTVDNPRTLKIKEEVEYFRKRLKFSGKLLLKGSDYIFMKGLELNNRYDKHTYEIKENDTVRMWCEFTINDCSFDDAKKTCEISVQPRDEYTLIQENWEKEINALGVEKSNYDLDIKSYLVFKIDARPEGGSPPSPPSDYKLYYQRTFNISSQYGGVWMADVYFYAQERAVVEEGRDMSGWSLIESLDNFKLCGREWSETYYSAPTDDDFYISYDPEDEKTINDEEWNLIQVILVWSGELPVGEKRNVYYIKKDVYSGGNYCELSNTYTCYKLEDVFNKVLSESTPGFTGVAVSTLLFNSDKTEGEPDMFSNKYGYDYVTNISRKFKYLISKDDFLRPTSSNLATINTTTLKKLIEYFKKFQIEWHIDTSGNLRLEHVSYYYFSDVGTNLLDKGTTRKYSYYNDETPNRIIIDETETGGEDFSQKQIIYGDIPAVDGTQEKKDSYSFSEIYVDVDWLNQNLDRLNNDGFVMIEIDGGVVPKTLGIASGYFYQNAGLSLANVIYYYWRHDCHKPTFELYGYSALENPIREAITLKKMKKHEIEFTHDYYIDTLKEVETFLGAGEFVTLEYPPVEGGTIKAEIRYE